MNTEFFVAFEELEREKHIPKEYMLNELQKALTKAYEEQYQTKDAEIRVVANEKKKDIKVYRVRKVIADIQATCDPIKQIRISDAKQYKKRVSVGDDFLEELKTKTFSYLAISKAKGMVIQAIKEYTKKQSKLDLDRKKEELITAEVVDVRDDGSISVNTGSAILYVESKDLIPNETYEIGKSYKFYVQSTKTDDKDLQITLSRTHKKLMARLFELEVPEIQHGEVYIRQIVRDPGVRAKIAVESRSGLIIDPVGTCIGEKHSRVEAVSRELNNEKIDIVAYSDSPENFVYVALAPAKIKRVEKVGENQYRAYVEEDQYSLAIGKKGLNVSLAAKLTGVKIDIIKE